MCKHFCHRTASNLVLILAEYMDILNEIFEYPKKIMPLYIKDNATAALVTQLAKSRGLTKQDAVKLAVKAELDRDVMALSLGTKFAQLRAAHPLPVLTGQIADKAFFDDLSGGV